MENIDHIRSDRDQRKPELVDQEEGVGEYRPPCQTPPSSSSSSSSYSSSSLSSENEKISNLKKSFTFEERLERIQEQLERASLKCKILHDKFEKLREEKDQFFSRVMCL